MALKNFKLPSKNAKGGQTWHPNFLTWGQHCHYTTVAPICCCKKYIPAQHYFSNVNQAFNWLIVPKVTKKKICVFQVTRNFKIGTVGRKIFLFC